MKAKKKDNKLADDLLNEVLGNAAKSAKPKKESLGLSMPKPFAKQKKGSVSSTEVALAQSENLKLAQQKILELENEVERLREENEALGAAGEAISKKADELVAKSESLDKKFADSKEAFEGEKAILLKTVKDKDKQVSEYQVKVEELEMRLNNNIRKIRVRERELENRLELMKMESSALMLNKDEFILDLKRQIDQVNYELGNYRNKGAELNKRLSEKQEMLSRTVKTLRLALAMIEGSDNEELKKAI